MVKLVKCKNQMCAYLTWNQKQLTNLLKTNKGRIHRAEKVAESTGAVHDHTHWAAFSCPPKLKLNVSRASIKGRTMPLKAKIERQKTPPFNKLHCNVLCKIRGSLKKNHWVFISTRKKLKNQNNLLLLFFYNFRSIYLGTSDEFTPAFLFKTTLKLDLAIQCEYKDKTSETV